jgi:hypothetical protein
MDMIPNLSLSAINHRVSRACHATLLSFALLAFSHGAFAQQDTLDAGFIIE